MMLYLPTLLLLFSIASAEECGPLGYEAKNLLSPNYWYFDLGPGRCPPIPVDAVDGTGDGKNATCRIYFNLCKKLTYQCSGTVCARYLNTTDLISLLGEYNKHTFTEPLTENDFIADYVGEKLHCQAGQKNVKTRFYFICHPNATWPISITGSHGGSRAPQPIVSFDTVQCQLTFKFNYTGACWTPSSHDSLVKNISTGTYAIILFFPGVLLYFIMGILFNRSRGKQGVDAIPHWQLLEDLPELILDGFMFTVSVVTCSHEERYTNDYEEVIGS